MSVSNSQIFMNILVPNKLFQCLRSLTFMLYNLIIIIGKIFKIFLNMLYYLQIKYIMTCQKVSIYKNAPNIYIQKVIERVFFSDNSDYCSSPVQLSCGCSSCN